MTEYGEILYSVQMRENADQNNCNYGQSSHSVTISFYSSVMFVNEAAFISY